MSSLTVFNDSVAVITGGASGIGRAYGEELARRGCEVVLCDRQAELAKAAAEGINNAGGKATHKVLDVRDAKAFKQIIDETVSRLGRLDYLFNIAGICNSGDAVDLSADDWENMIAVNVIGVTNGIASAYPHMRKEGFGHIINMSSITGMMTMPGMAGYSASKHAILALSKAIRIEAQPHGIRVTAICPGAVDTPILDGGAFGTVHGYSRKVIRKFADGWGPIPASVFAARTLDLIAKNKSVVVYPQRLKVLWWLNRFLPQPLEMALTGVLHERNKSKMDKLEAQLRSSQ